MLLFNCLLIEATTSNHYLHTSKLLAVVNLAVIDIVLNSSTIPSMIGMFLLKENSFLFILCLLQMFSYYSFATPERLSLAIPTYDRLITLCFPLQHHSVNTLWSVSCIVPVAWCSSLGFRPFSAGIMTWLSFCKSVTVYSQSALLWPRADVLSCQQRPHAVLGRVQGCIQHVLLASVSARSNLHTWWNMSNMNVFENLCLDTLHVFWINNCDKFSSKFKEFESEFKTQIQSNRKTI